MPGPSPPVMYMSEYTPWVYEDMQIHTKTGFRPIKSQDSRSGLHTNRTSYNNIFLLTGLRIYTGEYKAQGPTLCPTEGRALRGSRALYSPV